MGALSCGAFFMEEIRFQKYTEVCNRFLSSAYKECTKFYKVFERRISNGSSSKIF